MDSSSDCLGVGFTSLHYDSQDSGSRGPGDALDLYTMRDECYPSDDCLGEVGQRTLHTDFQGFQHYSVGQGSSLGFQQNPYAEYQGYQSLPSTSRYVMSKEFVHALIAKYVQRSQQRVG